MPYMILYRQVLLRDSSKLSCIADSYNQEKSLIRQTYPRNHQGENVFPWLRLWYVVLINWRLICFFNLPTSYFSSRNVFHKEIKARNHRQLCYDLA